MEYQFRSLHEEADCEHCDDLDGQIFPIDEAAVGINLPPIHPFCRCRITCVPLTVEEIEQEIDDMLRDMGMQEGEDPDEFISRKVKEQIAADEQAKAQEQAGLTNQPSGDIIQSDYASNAQPSLSETLYEKDVQEKIKHFPESLDNMKNQKLANIFRKAHEDVKYTYSNYNTSYYQFGGNTIGLTEDSQDSSIAHELFHKIDEDHGFVSDLLEIHLKNDYAKLQEYANVAGLSIESYLYHHYPQAFFEKGIMNIEYRGLSDMINGMSNGDIILGFSHPKNYWDEDKTRYKKEAFAQYGSFYYQENQEVLRVVGKVFPSTTEFMEIIFLRL